MNEDRVIDIQKSVQVLGHDKAKALIGFHAFTGCDTTEKFRSKTKLKWWKMFEKSSATIVRAFSSLGKSENLDEDTINDLE